MFATPVGGQQQKARRIGGASVETFVPKPCRVIGTVTTGDGKPERRARLRIGGEKATTDRDGVFSVRLTPFVEQTVTIISKRWGKARTRFRPECGIGRLRFVLNKGGIRVV